MNINDVLVRVPKKDEQTSQQILHRNEEMHPQGIIAREARHRGYAKKLQNESEHPVEILMLEDPDRKIFQKEAYERRNSDELKIKKEAKDQKRLRVAARELDSEKGDRLMKAEEEIAQLKRALAAMEDKKIQAQSSKKKNSRQEDSDKVDDEGDFKKGRPGPVSSTARRARMPRRNTLADSYYNKNLKEVGENFKFNLFSFEVV